MEAYIKHLQQTNFGEALNIMDSLGRSFVCVYYYSDDENTAYVSNLSVLPECRRRKLAEKILAFAEMEILKMGFKEVILLVSWRRDNSWLHDWYLKLGYIDMMRHEKDPDSIWMCKQLINM